MFTSELQTCNNPGQIFAAVQSVPKEVLIELPSENSSGVFRILSKWGIYVGKHNFLDGGEGG